MKPPSPLLAPEQQALKPTTPLQPKNARKTPISRPQRRWRFQLGLSLCEQRRWRFQLGLGPREQRRRRFHARDFRCRWAVAEPGRASSRGCATHQHRKRHWCGGRRRARRARAGFEIDHSERSSRVAISRAAGPSGARNTSGATSTAERRSLRTPRSTPGFGRPGGRRGGRAR